MGIFQRKPSALAPLDGLRAIAILWVFFLHSVVLKIDSYPNFGCLLYEKFFWTNWWAQAAVAGCTGVDIFFVLSGFLIGYILLKEIKKYGQLDLWNFYRGRFLRIWPVMMLRNLTYLGITAGIPDPDNKGIHKLIYESVGSATLFLNNFIGKDQHIWSIAVEFQFYLISPILVYFMAKSEKPWLAPLIIFLIATVCNCMITLGVCPTAYQDVAAITGEADNFTPGCNHGYWY